MVTVFSRGPRKSGRLHGVLYLRQHFALLLLLTLLFWRECRAVSWLSPFPQYSEMSPVSRRSPQGSSAPYAPAVCRVLCLLQRHLLSGSCSADFSHFLIFRPFILIRMQIFFFFFCGSCLDSAATHGSWRFPPESFVLCSNLRSTWGDVKCWVVKLLFSFDI